MNGTDVAVQPSTERRTVPAGPRVLLLLDTLCVGGAETSMLDLALRFRTVCPVVCHVYPGDDLRGAFEDAGIAVYSLNISAKYGLVSAFRRVHEIVRRERIDVVHAVLYRASLVGRMVAWATGLPLVESLVSDSYSSSRLKLLSPSRRAKLAVTRWIHRVTKAPVTEWAANSAVVKRSLGRALGVDEDRIQVIHRGRDPGVFRPDGTERSEPIIPGHRCIVAVGRLIESKGLQDLVRAMQRVSASCPDAMLCIAGDGPYRETLARMISKLSLDDHVMLLGHRTDVPSLLRRADLFAFASYYEGHSGAVIEAMLSGLAIVASDIPENRESLDDGSTALLVRPGDAEGIAFALTTLMRDREVARAMGQRARAYAIDRFSSGAVVAQHEELYRRALLRATPGASCGDAATSPIKGSA